MVPTLMADSPAPPTIQPPVVTTEAPQSCHAEPPVGPQSVLTNFANARPFLKLTQPTNASTAGFGPCGPQYNGTTNGLLNALAASPTEVAEALGRMTGRAKDRLAKEALDPVNAAMVGAMVIPELALLGRAGLGVRALRVGHELEGLEGGTAGAGTPGQLAREGVAGAGRPIVKDQGYWAANGRPDLAKLLGEVVNASPKLEVQALHFEAETGTLTIQKIFCKETEDLMVLAKEWATKVKTLGIKDLDVLEIGTRNTLTGLVKSSPEARRELIRAFPRPLPSGIQEIEALARAGTANNEAQLVAAVKGLVAVPGLDKAAATSITNFFYQAFYKTVYAKEIAAVRKEVKNVGQLLAMRIAQSAGSTIEFEGLVLEKIVVDGATEQLILQRFATLEKLIVDYLRNIGLPEKLIK